MTLGIVGHSFTLFVTVPGEIYRLPRRLLQNGVNYAQLCPDTTRIMLNGCGPAGHSLQTPF